ncbi:DUF4145 domain-containing protein [Mesorhizobium caraganae]|uniref:DUF4145 domain-containing protein n=1 Tax=Mesorhizobium caraganae TaxID=483206 RepID=UPI001786C627|nr:DUF4145 domain-containing protein [Mesorhizobium caraganae]
MQPSVVVPMTTGQLVLEYLRLLVELLSALAWPVAALLIVLIFRKPLLRLVTRMKAFTGPGGVGATFAFELEKAREAAEDTELPEVEQAPATLTSDDPFFAFAQTFPEAAALEAYRELESFVAVATKEMGVRLRPFQVIRGLYQQGHIDDSVKKLYERIRSTRDAAVHSRRPITRGEALDFRELVRTLIAAIREVLPKLNTAGLIRPSTSYVRSPPVLRPLPVRRPARRNTPKAE